MEPVIEVHNLVKRFADHKGNPITVLDGVTFDVEPGETLVVMGGSGCGKSTLLNCLIAEYMPDEGEIVYRLRELDEPLSVAGADEKKLNELRKSFGILFQSGALFNSMSVAENVALPLREHSYVDPSVVDIMVTMKLQLVRMLPHRDKMPAQLSGGQKKRAGLARALALDPEILFYDEPSAGLDPVTAARLDELILQLSRTFGVTFVIVTHELQSIFSLAGQAIMLDKESKGIIAEGNPNDMKNDRSNPAVWRFFNRMAATEAV